MGRPPAVRGGTAARRDRATAGTPAALGLAALALAAACAPVEERMAESDGATPHQTYAAGLREAELHRTALGRDWLDVAERALTDPTGVELPHREVRYLDPAEAAAVAFRVPLESGQRLVVEADVASRQPAGLLLFLDLFYDPVGPGGLERVASADSARWRLEHVATRGGDYLLRAQPELLRGGRLTVTLTAEASLAFPVGGAERLVAMRSGFGDTREGGREHEGIDLVAPKGTPVVAAVAGRVTRVGTEPDGGNVVWLDDPEHHRELYYAHLDGHAVAEGVTVAVGDTLGTVGNTGNAQTTRPHLHFGVFLDGGVPVDPWPHLRDPPDEVVPFTADPALLGRRVRVPEAGATLRERPTASSAETVRLAGHTALEVVGGSGAWYAARLPDGRHGYLRPEDARPLTALRRAPLAAGAMLRTTPGPEGAGIDSLAAGTVVSVLGRFGEDVLVRHGDATRGWLPTAALSPAGRDAAARG